MAYQQGGWYDNPATGQNQRWMNGAFVPNAGSTPASGASSDPMSAVSDMISKYQAAQDAYNAKESDYYKNNPFNRDDQLAAATNEATSALNPYYTELLGNFMAGINYTRQNSLEDENRAVTNLQADVDAYTGQAKSQLQQTLLQAGQQFSDSGSYDSGARARTQGYDSAQSAYDIANQQRAAAYNIQTQKLQSSRLINQNIPLNISNENLQQGQNYSNDLKNLASQDYQNAVSAYTYKAGNTIGAPPGMDATAYQNQIASQMPYINQNIPSSLPTSLQLPAGG
jgi:hypothetical protein